MGQMSLHSFVLPARLELSTLRSTREGDDVADVLHAGDEEDETLEAEAETCVGA